MQHEFTYILSLDLVKLDARRFVLRTSGPWLLGLLATMIFGFAVMVTGWGCETFVMATILSGMGLFFWHAIYREMVKTADRLRDRRVAVRIEPESITFQTSEYTTTMKWSCVKKLERFHDVWRLSCGERTYWILPVASLEEEVIRFVEDKVQEHGGQIC